LVVPSYYGDVCLGDFEAFGWEFYGFLVGFSSVWRRFNMYF